MALFEAPMNLKLNGEDRAFSGVSNLAQLVAALGLDHRKIAVELNLEIVPRSAYQVTAVAEGDRIEIVHFIGGG
jgi:sulfur carrier protein